MRDDDPRNIRQRERDREPDRRPIDRSIDPVIASAYLAAQMDCGRLKPMPFRVLPEHEQRLLERFAARVLESGR